MKSTSQVWNQMGNRLYLSSPANEHELLENVVYTVKYDPDRRAFYLIKVTNEFKFGYKLYGLETSLIDRVIKTYKTTGTGNLGVLLNGVKGTGKTVSSKIIANSIQQPTIIVSDKYDGVQYFLNSIQQDVTIFIDEYEKIYGQSNDMLTIMDGAMNSEFRRLFLLTTNKMNIEDNMKQRPSRIRYIKRFSDLAPNVVEEIVDDILEFKQFKDDCIKFMTTLELITVDIVKAIVNEVNIHEESPFDFGDIFNVNKIEGKYKIFSGDMMSQTNLEADNVNIWPRPDYTTDYVGSWLEINGNTIGQIVEVFDQHTLGIAIMGKDNEVVETMVVRIERTYGTHYAYAYNNGRDANASKIDGKLKTIIFGNEEARKVAKKKSNILGLGDLKSYEDVSTENYQVAEADVASWQAEDNDSTETMSKSSEA